MDDPSSADIPKVPEEMSSQFNSALKRARETEDEVVSDSMLIQTSFVGLVIGKGGETIRNFQERTQCKMYMIQDGEYANAPEKLLTFQGLKSRVEEAKRLIKEFLEDKDKYPSGPPGTTKVEVTVPQDCVGLIIGRGGETIKKISAETNCRVHFNPEKTGYAEPIAKNGERVCIFEGLPQEIQAAQQRVRDIVEMVIRKNSPQTMNIVLTEGSELYEVVVTASKAGMIVGRGGEFIQLIMQSTGTQIEFNKGVVDNGQTKTLLISGVKEQIDRARQMMVDKAGENNVNPLQPPTNVLVSYVPAQPAWSDPYAASSGYDPSAYYQQQGMWAAGATDGQAVDPNVASYYANMTPEEYAAAWASYYQQYQQYAYSATTAASADGESELPLETKQPSLETPITNQQAPNLDANANTIDQINSSEVKDGSISQAGESATNDLQPDETAVADEIATDETNKPGDQ